MAYDDGSSLLERGQQPDDVAHQVQHRVGGGFIRGIAATVAALIGGDSVEACTGKGCQLVAPGVPAFREAMEQDYERTLSRFGEVQMMPLVSTKRWVISGISRR